MAASCSPSFPPSWPTPRHDAFRHRQRRRPPISAWPRNQAPMRCRSPSPPFPQEHAEPTAYERTPVAPVHPMPPGHSRSFGRTPARRSQSTERRQPNVPLALLIRMATPRRPKTRASMATQVQRDPTTSSLCPARSQLAFRSRVDFSRRQAWARFVILNCPVGRGANDGHYALSLAPDLTTTRA